jgi:hypothetical protein
MFLAVFVLALTAGSAQAAPGHGPLLPPLPAPDQSDVPPLLDMLERRVPRQVLMVPGANLIVDLDGGVDVRPRGVVLFSLSWGRTKDHVQARRALEETFDQRAAIRERYRKVAIESALSDLPSYLDKVWMRTDWPLELRRRILFQLWDECAERGPEVIVHGGAAARAIILRFIEWRLPSGSAHGFTDAELDELNARRDSVQRFSPYGQSPRPLYQARMASLSF